MTDNTTETTTSAGDVRARNQAIVFAALADAGIHRVTVEYDGSGDSGQIENVEASDAAGKSISLPDTGIHLVSGHPEHPGAERTLEQAIENVAWDYLDDLYCGWENNDGAFGRFVFDVPARTLTLEHNERYTEVHTSAHEFSARRRWLIRIITPSPR
jgi:hypothetical protein